MSESAHAVPESAATLHVAPQTPTQKVFECARQRLAQLGEDDALWDHKVTREDVPHGVLETGDFPEDNISGFRLHLQHDPASGSVALRLRGAGAYFVDQGVEAGLKTFEEGFSRCLAAP
ncbi:hypothetical protein [Stenotrophomonas sp.]|uniref:hypothetical protein n=1 Tax=Stenotrophomonas sp. TaxID=69392 RepID=UPI002D2CF8FB|nr:hypothetical protein [Stenotrophomonas sp.]HYQ25501.1 hypothetical protein [Stenotrophomonas sp.]